MSKPATVLEFPPFRLDLRAERLWRGDEAIDLRPKTWQLAVHMAKRPGELLTKEELLDAVWAEVSVTTASLNQAVLELRRALGDDARRPRFVETVHRRGFRFIARIRSADDSPEPVGQLSREVPRLSLHGRRSELEQLRGLLERADAGQRQVAFVTGEPGIGKTRLTSTFVEELGANPMDRAPWVGIGQCVDLHGRGEAYLPFLDALDRLIRAGTGTRVQETLRRCAPTWLAQLPWLLEQDQLDPTLIAATPTRMLREMCVAVEELTRERTLVIWLEDLHWSDTATIELIDALARRPEPCKLLVLVSYRPVEAAVSRHPVAPLKRALVDKGLAVELALELLAEPAVADYLSERLAERAQRPRPAERSSATEALTSLVHSQTHGNPLFVVTLVDNLVHSGRLAESEAGWELVVPAKTLHEVLPETLQDVIEAQLGAFAEGDVAALEAAAVVGQSFAAQSVGAALEVDSAVAEAACDLFAGTGGFLDRTDVASWPDGSVGQRYTFRHDAFRSALYKRIPPARLQQLHRRIALRAESAFSNQPGQHAAELAAHAELGGDLDRAVRYLGLAAENVRRRFADREAVTYLERALELLNRLPDSDDRLRRELGLRQQQATALLFAASYSDPQLISNLGRCHEVAVQLGDQESQLRASCQAAHSRLVEVDLAAVEALVREQLQLEPSVADPVLTASSLLASGNLALLRGELEVAGRDLEKAAATLKDTDPREAIERLGHDPAISALCFASWTAWLLGSADQARRHSSASRSRAQASGAPLPVVLSTGTSATLSFFLRDEEALRERLRDLETLAEEFGISYPYPPHRAAVGWLLARSSGLQAGIDSLRESWLAARQAKSRFCGSLVLATLAELELETGDTEAGLASVGEALRFIEDSGERLFEAEILRVHGRLLEARGRKEEATKRYREAVEVARRQGAVAVERRALRHLA